MATVGAMPTRLHSVVFDAADPAALARFWSSATGWPVTYEEPDEVVVEPPEDESGVPTEPGLPLIFGRVDDPKVVKNRVHIDLDARSQEDQAALVERLLQAGATPADVGQRDVPWVVLADPEGNELCVLDPRDDYERSGAIAAIVLDTPDPAALAPFWAAATGWSAEPEPDGDVRLVRPDGLGPHLELLRNDDAKVAKNRVHLDVAPGAGDDQAAEVDRLRALGATDADVGQGTQTWVVLADPHGNELCVLSPRD
jgi:catechol 2,3-dioxygenase-like lactoylglutathione lyase family enzyme